MSADRETIMRYLDAYLVLGWEIQSFQGYAGNDEAVEMHVVLRKPIKVERQ